MLASDQRISQGIAEKTPSGSSHSTPQSIRAQSKMDSENVNPSSEETPVIECVKDGDLETLKREVSEIEQAAFEEGGESNRREVVSTMVNERDQYGRTPLHFAFSGEESQVAIARFLLEKGADVNAKDNRGNTPLFTIADGVGIAKAAGIVMRGHMHNRLKETGRVGQVDVDGAMDRSSKDIATEAIALMNLFISFGGNCNLSNKEGQTPIKFLCAAATVDLIQEILKTNVNFTSFQKAFTEFLDRAAVTERVAEFTDVESESDKNSESSGSAPGTPSKGEKGEAVVNSSGSGCCVILSNEEPGNNPIALFANDAKSQADSQLNSGQQAIANQENNPTNSEFDEEIKESDSKNLPENYIETIFPLLYGHAFYEWLEDLKISAKEIIDNMLGFNPSTESDKSNDCNASTYELAHVNLKPSIFAPEITDDKLTSKGFDFSSLGSTMMFHTGTSLHSGLAGMEPMLDNHALFI